MAADCGPGCSPTSRMPPRCARRTAWTCGWNAGTGRSRSSTAGSSSAASTCPTSFSSGCARRRSDTPRPPLRDACGREGAPLSCVLLNKWIVCRFMDGIAVLAGIVAGIALGGALGWLVGGARGRVQAERALREVEGRAQAAAATVDELRRSQASSQSRAEGLEAELRRLEGERAAMAARAGELERGLTEQRRLLDDAKGVLGTTYQALAAEALQRSNEGFLQIATEKLAAARREGTTDLAAREQAIAALVTPLRQSLEKIDQQAQALERSRGEAYVELKAQVGFLMQGQDRLRTATGNLVNALRAPAVRGRWGEIQLRRVLELAGMVEHCDFAEQASLDTADGRLRPDVVVRLPGGKSIVVDAKAPMGAYLSAHDAKTEAEQQQHLQHHAAQVKAHVHKLGAKSYWNQFTASPELVVMFLPGDRFYAAALEQIPGLIEEAFANRVLVATPIPLIGILQAIHAGWRS